jgi:NAD(P)-dependent dehydrogenase (short-subunit alcohol dehydrogenase family)
LGGEAERALRHRSPSDEERTTRLVQEVLDRFGRIDVLVNRASLYDRGRWNEQPPTMFAAISTPTSWRRFSAASWSGW